jgi:uncharacterized protein YbjT (DUF2867 family)
MIVVTGATGHVGRELVAQLAGIGAAVRAVTRRPGASAFPAGVEVVKGDFDDRASLTAAFRGAEGAFLMSAQAVGSAPHPTHDLGLVEAAIDAGVTRVVKLSVLDGGATEDPIGLWHREAEAAVTGSGLEWTLVRPGRFMSNALAWAPMIARGDTVKIPFAFRPTAPIDPADIAAVAAVALTEGGHHQRAYPLSGPQVLTPADELRTLAGILHRDLQLLEPPVETTRSGMIAAGMAEPVVDAIVARALAGQDGAEALSTVEQVLGRRPATFSQWARNHAALFRLEPGRS